MLAKFKLTTISITLLCHFQATAANYVYRHPKAQALAAGLQSTLEGKLPTDHWELNTLYRDLPRNEISGEDLVELKFLMAFYKTKFPLSKSIEKTPRKNLDIRPVKPSMHSYERWSSDPDFSNYEFTDEGVNFRGLSLKSGDIILVNHNESTDQLFTSFTEDRGSFSHLAVFIVLNRKGRRIPAVIEMHKKGIRAIPLSVFLGPKFISYAEVYRHRDPPSQWYQKLQVEGQKLLGESHGYDLNSDNERRHLTCSEVGSVLWERTGAATIQSRSAVAPQALLNLNKLGFVTKTMLTPSDFSKDTLTHFIGAIDNGNYTQRVLRELVMLRVRELLTQCTLQTSQLPAQYELGEYILRKTENHAPLGFALRTSTGFKQSNFPSGPSKLMPFIPLANKAVTRAVKTLEEDAVLRKFILNNGSIHLIEQHPLVKQRVQKATEELSSWFTETCSNLNYTPAPRLEIPAGARHKN